MEIGNPARGQELGPTHIWFVTHPEVIIDPHKPVPQWSLSKLGIERMQAFCCRRDLVNISAIWSSAETKAVESADILSRHLGIDAQVEEQLHENDRSSTGYLPSLEFEAMADRFFANPEHSVEGWERAVDAQSRIVAAIRGIAERHGGGGDLAIVAHGGVGALMMASLKRAPISRALDQPGSGGGNFFVFATQSNALVREWTNISTPD